MKKGYWMICHKWYTSMFVFCDFYIYTTSSGIFFSHYGIHEHHDLFCTSLGVTYWTMWCDWQSRKEFHWMNCCHLSVQYSIGSVYVCTGLFMCALSLWVFEGCSSSVCAQVTHMSLINHNTFEGICGFNIKQQRWQDLNLTVLCHNRSSSLRYIPFFQMFKVCDAEIIVPLYSVLFN